MSRLAAKTLCALTGLGMAFAPKVFAQPEGETTRHLRVATREFLPPYIYEHASTGIEIDLVNAIFRDMPFEVDYVQLPRVRMISSFEDHQLDGILTQNIRNSNTGCATHWYIEHQNVAFSDFNVVSQDNVNAVIRKNETTCRRLY